jgi:hypothetical protein
LTLAHEQLAASIFSILDYPEDGTIYALSIMDYPEDGTIYALSILDYPEDETIYALSILDYPEDGTIYAPAFRGSLHSPSSGWRNYHKMNARSRPKVWRLYIPYFRRL